MRRLNMGEKKSHVSAVLQFCEAYRPQPDKVTEDYISEYSKRLETRLAELRFIRQEAGIPHNSFEWGYTLYSYIKNGDVEGLADFYYRERDWLPGMPTDDPLRDIKINSVSLISGITNFIAMDRLIENELGYTIADACIQLIEESKTLLEVRHNVFAGIYKYTLLVQEYRQRTYHPLIQRVKAYVSQHLHQEIAIQDMAQELGVSPEHLSRVYRKAEGHTLKEYISNQRLIQIKKQLQFSRMPIQEISRYLGYSSQSHMTAVFRKATGVTPNQYRMMFEENK